MASTMDGELTDELLAALVRSLVAELRPSMLGFYLRRAVEAEVSRSDAKLAELLHPPGDSAGRRSKSAWRLRLRNVVFQRLQSRRRALAGGELTDGDIENAINASIEKIASSAGCLTGYGGVQGGWGGGNSAGEGEGEGAVGGRGEPMGYVRQAQADWERRIVKSINSMCTELNVALAKKRSDKEQREMASKWSELGATCPDLTQFRPVYAAKDFLDVIVALRNPNHDPRTPPGAACGLIELPLRVRGVAELRRLYSELSISRAQTGVDDAHDLPAGLWGAARDRLGASVVTANESAAAQEYCKRGCPMSHRAALWCTMLGLALDDVDVLYYDGLKQSVLQHQLLIDSLTFKDVKLTATNDDQYFVFEDYLYQVLLPFSRDTAVLDHFVQSGSAAAPARAYIRGRHGAPEAAVVYPPSGVVPFHGFAMYAAPLCYVYNDPATLYHVFRALYTRYFHRLHALSSHPQGIVSLCAQFERVVQRAEPRLVAHLRGAAGVQPLRLAFKWLIRAFSGYLAAEQVLLLWDRVLAYDSMEILPFLAAAIFSFRRANLLQVQSLNAAEAVLADLTTLEVAPLLQLFLFPVPHEGAGDAAAAK